MKYFYSFIKYLKNQSSDQSSKYFYNIGILSAVGTGINLFFLGSLLFQEPITCRVEL